MRLRILNAAGMAEAYMILDRLRSGELDNVPAQFVESDEFSATTSWEFRKPRLGEFSSRWHFGIWLWRELQEASTDSVAISAPGLWTWLAFFLLDTIAPVGSRVRTIKEDARYVLVRGDYRKYYRHLVAGPFMIMRVHSDEPHIIRGLLATPPESPGDVYEQLASRPQIVNSRAAVSTATALYYDRSANQLRRGAAGAGPGSARRLASVLMQYDVTFDLPRIESEQLFAMLPKEFDRFRGNGQSMTHDND